MNGVEVAILRTGLSHIAFLVPTKAHLHRVHDFLLEAVCRSPPDE